MGAAGSKKFLDADPDWTAYTTAEWRSHRARELDSLGGLQRSAVASGKSMTSKLDYLGKSLEESGKHLSDSLYAPNPGLLQHAPSSRHARTPDIRPAHRSSVVVAPASPLPEKAVPPAAGATPLGRAPSNAADQSWGTAEAAAELKRQQLEQRRLMMQYGQRLSDVHIKSAALPGKAAPRPTLHVLDITAGKAPVSPALAMIRTSGPQVAEWRLRVHAARRRALMYVLVVVRLMRDSRRTRTGAPRMRRVDSFSWVLSSQLGGESGKFVAEQRKYAQARADVEIFQALIEQMDDRPTTSTTSSPPPSTAPHSPMLSARSSLFGGASSIDLNGDQQHYELYGKGLGSGGLSREPSLVMGGGDPHPDAGGAFHGNGDTQAQSLAKFLAQTSAAQAQQALQKQALVQRVERKVHSPTGMRPLTSSMTKSTPTSPQYSGTVTLAGRFGSPTGQHGGGVLPPTPVFDSLADFSSNRVLHPSASRGRRRVSTGTPLLSPLPSNSGRISSIHVVAHVTASISLPPKELSLGDMADGPRSPPATCLPDIGSRPDSAGNGGGGRRGGGLGGGRLLSLQATTSSPSSSPSTPFNNSTVVFNGVNLSPSRPMTQQYGRHSKQGPLLTALTAPQGALAAVPLPTVAREALATPPRRESYTGRGGITSPVVSLRSQTNGKRFSTPGSVLDLGGVCAPASPLAAPVEVPGGASPAAAAVLGTLTGAIDVERQRLLSNAAAEFQVHALQSERLLRMFINRHNAGWAEAQQWRRPTAWDGCAADYWSKGNQAMEYKKLVEDVLFRGQLAIQLFAGEDSITLPDGRQVELWEADPWQLLESCRPGCMPLTDRIEGVCMGTRVLLQLVLAVRAAGGEHAVRQLTLVMHVADSQAGEVLADFVNRGFYGLLQRNVIFVVGPRWPGYRFSAEHGHFCQDPMGLGEPLGGGHGLMQCAWPGEAFTLLGDDRCEPLGSPVLDELQRRNVSWMMSHRMVDLSLLSAEGALDLTLLAYTMFLHDRYSVNMAVQVMETDSIVLARAHDSVIFSRQIATPTPVAATTGYIAAPASPAVTRANDVEPMTELRLTELVSPLMNDTLEKIKASSANKLLVGLNKYVFHVGALVSCMGNANIFRPKLCLSGELVTVRMDLNDVMTAAKARCVPVLAPSLRVRHILSIPADAVNLVPLLQRQDHDGSFRKLLAQHRNTSHAVMVVQGSIDPRQKPGQRIAVLIDFRTPPAISERAVACAAALARPGRDTLYIVTAVATQAHCSAGEALVQRYYLSVIKTMVHTVTIVLVQYPWPLLDTINFFLKRTGVQMAIMGSVNITNIGRGNMLAMFDSVTLACIKRFSIPLVVVTLNCCLVTPDYAKKETLRAMVLAERHAKPVVDILCRSLDPARGDKFVIVQVLESSLTREQRSGARRMLDALAEVAAAHHVGTFKRVQAVGRVEAVLPQFQLDHRINLMGVQLPLGRRVITPHLLALITSSRCPVLIYGGGPRPANAKAETSP